MTYPIKKDQIVNALKDSGCKLTSKGGGFYFFETNHSYYRYIVRNYSIDVAQKNSFDRWANSKCSEIKIHHVNYDPIGDFGWKEEDVINNIKKRIGFCETINSVIPNELFDNFLRYEI